MKAPCPPCIVLITLLLLAISVNGCSKKVKHEVAAIPAAPERSPKEAPAPLLPLPKITLSASPTTIEAGESSRLFWDAENATSLKIDPGIGDVEISGSRNISPEESTTYKAVASGPGGSSEASVRLTVTKAPGIPPSQALSDAEFFETHIRDVFFDFDRYSIREDARQVLFKNAQSLLARPRLLVRIEGHCDERGSERYNLALGDRRASSVKDFLISQGIDQSRLHTMSYGEEYPFAEGSHEASWQQNRRAHFVLKGSSD